MYEWIPMEFDLEFEGASGTIFKYFLRANNPSRDYFTTYWPNGSIGNDQYPLQNLLDRLMFYNGTINGMTKEELMGISVSDDKIDISNLI